MYLFLLEPQDIIKIMIKIKRTWKSDNVGRKVGVRAEAKSMLMHEGTEEATGTDSKIIRQESKNKSSMKYKFE